MRHFAAYACCILLVVLLYAGEAWCAVWEFHPGVYASYLYDDNYEGLPEEEEEEHVYAVGPSLALSCTTQHLQWGLEGHVAWNYHKNNEEDDTTEASVVTHALLSGLTQSLDLSYDYRETRERETLDQALGVRRVHTGALSYNRILTPTLSVSLGYVRNMEYAPPPDDDVVSDGGSLGLSYQATPRTSFGLSGSYTAYRYEESLEDDDEDVQDADDEVSQDAQVARASMQWTYWIAPQWRVGPSFGFERHTYDDPAEESSDPADQDYYSDLDIYTAALSLEYTLSPHTAVNASAGGSWLKPEDGDREYLTSGRCGLRHDTRDNHLLADFTYGYAYDYDAQNDLGIYETAAFNASWEHLFTPSLLSILGYSLSSRTLAQTDTAAETLDEEDTQDITYRAGLTYRTSIGEGTLGLRGLIAQGKAGETADAEASLPSPAPAASETDSIHASYESRAGTPLTTHWPRGMLEVRALYERLEHEYEHSDSVTENRYSITIEVRY